MVLRPGAEACPLATAMRGKRVDPSCLILFISSPTRMTSARTFARSAVSGTPSSRAAAVRARSDGPRRVSSSWLVAFSIAAFKVGKSFVYPGEGPKLEPDPQDRDLGVGQGRELGHELERRLPDALLPLGVEPLEDQGEVARSRLRPRGPRLDQTQRSHRPLHAGLGDLDLLRLQVLDGDALLVLDHEVDAHRRGFRTHRGDEENGGQQGRGEEGSRFHRTPSSEVCENRHAVVTGGFHQCQD